MITMSDLLTLLDLEGIHHRYVGEGPREILAVPMPTRGRMTWIQITVEEDGEYVRFHVPGLSSMPGEKKAAGRVKTALLDMNRRLKLAKFGHDPSDGEIDLEIGVPVIDGTFTQKMLERCMRTMIHASHDMLVKIDEAKFGEKASAKVNGTVGLFGRPAGRRRPGMPPAPTGIPGLPPDLAALLADAAADDASHGDGTESGADVETDDTEPVLFPDDDDVCFDADVPEVDEGGNGDGADTAPDGEGGSSPDKPVSDDEPGDDG